jgi:hypothetical protein
VLIKNSQRVAMTKTLGSGVGCLDDCASQIQKNSVDATETHNRCWKTVDDETAW